MENIKCPCCNTNILEEGISIEGYITYNTIAKNKFTPNSIELALKHNMCLNCKSTVDSSIINQINITYPQIKSNKNNFKLHCRCTTCGQLSTEGIYSLIKFNVISMEKFYEMKNDICNAYIEKKLYPNKRYIAIIVWESEEFYCEECHEVITDLRNPPNFQNFINNETIIYKII